MNQSEANREAISRLLAAYALTLLETGIAPYAASVLMILAGAIQEGQEEELAMRCAMFAEERIKRSHASEN